MEPIDFVLTFDKGEWIAENEIIIARGKTLEELDENIKDGLKERFGAGGQIEVTMEFDYSTVPFWITQYHPYYIRRTVYIDI
jgi:protein involved in polysaccharide export with SLBB domain